VPPGIRRAVSLGACSAPPLLERAADVDRERSREVARGIAGVAPGPGEVTPGERLHEDGGGARAARAGDRAPATAADQIAPARSAKAGLTSSGGGQAYVAAWRRIGRNTASAMTAATMLRIAAITKTAVQLPVQLVSTLPNGTSNAAVPFAVYYSIP
jgi:hypothetical protein